MILDAPRSGLSTQHVTPGDEADAGIAWSKPLLTMKFSTALSVSATALAAAAVGYALYFDYKRRNDPAFRKKLRKQSKQSVKAAKKEIRAAAQQENMMIEKAVKDVAEPGVLPTGVQEKEALYVEHD